MFLCYRFVYTLGEKCWTFRVRDNQREALERLSGGLLHLDVLRILQSSWDALHLEHLGQEDE